MARFPFKPGAGVKGMKGGVYWSRLYLQESQRGRSRSRYSEEAHLTARWLNINTNLNFFMCGWLNSVVKTAHKLPSREIKSLNDAFENAIDFRDTIDSSWDYMSQANLNKFVTRVKRLFLLVFKLVDKYDLYDPGEARLLSYFYDSKEKEFVLIYLDRSVKRMYFMGKPAVSQLAEIRRQNRKSMDMVAADLRENVPATKNKASNRKRKKPNRRMKPSTSSRTKGVVEEINEAGVVQFNYRDCVKRESAVRRRIKLHLKIAFQQHRVTCDSLSSKETIDEMISRSLRLVEGDSFKFPISHCDKKLVVFEFLRKSRHAPKKEAAKTSQNKNPRQERKTPAKTKIMKPNSISNPKKKISSRAKGVVEEVSETGVVHFKYIDFVERLTTVRRRLKLHLKVAFQPQLKYLEEGISPVFDGTIDSVVSHALKLDVGDSVEIPISHNDETLVVFEINR